MKPKQLRMIKKISQPLITKTFNSIRFMSSLPGLDSDENERRTLYIQVLEYEREKVIIIYKFEIAIKKKAYCSSGQQYIETT